MHSNKVWQLALHHEYIIGPTVLFVGFYLVNTLNILFTLSSAFRTRRLLNKIIIVGMACWKWVSF